MMGTSAATLALIFGLVVATQVLGYPNQKRLTPGEFDNFSIFILLKI